jgi:hypothetical protein
VLPGGIRFHNGGTSGFASSILIDPGRGRAVAMLASCGPVHMPSLDQAGKLALADEDPRAVRPQPIEPEWEDRAREVVQLLLDGRTGDFHARTTSYFQSQISAENLDQTWRSLVQEFGAAREVHVSSQRPTSHVIADVTVIFERDRAVVQLYFEPSGQIAGVKLT